MEQALDELTTLFIDILNRCEHCHGEPFWCQECEFDKARFLNAITDLLTALGVEPNRKFLAILFHAVIF